MHLEPFEIAAIGKCIALATGHRSVQGWLALKVNSNIIQKMTENREKVRTKADFYFRQKFLLVFFDIFTSIIYGDT